MALESVAEKATIVFPWSLTIRQLTDLADHVAEVVRGEVSYDISYSRKSGYKSGYVGFLRESKTESEGHITLPNPPFIFNNFDFIYQSKDLAGIRGIQFRTKPDTALSDYRSEIVKLWNDVRAAVENYFDDNPETDRND